MRTLFNISAALISLLLVGLSFHFYLSLPIQDFSQSKQEFTQYPLPRIYIINYIK